MIIIWGSGGDVVRLGEAGSRECPACRQDCPFSLVLRYSYGHLYYLFGMVTKGQFLVVCENCGNGWEVPADEVTDAKVLAKNAIPFMRRWGCLVLLVLGIVGFTLLMFVISGGERKFQQQPQQRRKVRADKPALARIENHFFSTAYSVLNPRR